MDNLTSYHTSTNLTNSAAWTNVTSLPEKIYSDLAEQVFAIALIAICSIFTFIGQSIVLLTIIKSPSLHNPHFYVIAGYCVGDLFGALITAPNYMMQFIAGPMPTTYCRIVSTSGIVLFLALVYITGLIAFERYLYFCQPYKYNAYMSVGRVSAALVVCYAVPALMGVGTELTIGRTYHSSILACNLPDSALQSSLQFGLILLPSAIVTVFSVLKVWRLTKRALVTPHQQQQAATVTPVKQALKAVRMVLLLSGTFWGTMIPGYIARIVIFTAGYTWDDMDTRRYLLPAIVMRIVAVMCTVVSSAVNPLIYYYSRKDLRIATRKLLGRNVIRPLDNETQST